MIGEGGGVGRRGEEMEGVEIMPEWSGQGSAHSDVREGVEESSGGIL